jgi:NCAIR mutase (PurE)-related protein
MAAIAPSPLHGGRAALTSALSPRAPSVTANINSGFGAARAAVKIVNGIRPAAAT